VAGFAVQIWPTDLPKGWHERRAELRRLSKVVSVPVSEMLKGIRARKGDPLTPVTVKEGIHPDQVAYLYERRADFHGVQIAQNYLRKYPYQSLAAQILGYPGEISAEQLKQRPQYKLGDTIGQAGVEATYDSYLRGRAGLAELRVDSSGEPRSALTKRVQPRPGNTIRLTLDVDLQRAAERRAPLRDLARARCRQLQRERRRDRRARPPRRLRPRAGLEPDLPALDLLRPRRSAEAQGGDRPDEGAAREPGDLRALSGGLDVQAGNGARRDAGAHHLPVRLARVHAEHQGTRVRRSRTGTRTRTR